MALITFFPMTTSNHCRRENSAAKAKMNHTSEGYRESNVVSVRRL